MNVALTPEKALRRKLVQQISELIEVLEAVIWGLFESKRAVVAKTVTAE